MKILTPNEFVLIDSWQKLCEEFGPPFRFINGFDADREFAEPDHNTIYVSGCCDCGPVYQAEHHPNQDLPKHLGCYDWGGIINERENYVRVMMTSVKDERCHPSHRFTMKTDRYTWCSFNQLPSMWLTVNANIDESQVMNLPFGLNTDGHGLSILPNYQGRTKTDLLYVNFQLNSHVRVLLHQYWSQPDQSWATFRETPNLAIETYLEELSRHKYCLAPAGNGWDAYRVWECIYLGVIPILEDSRWARHLLRTGLPVTILPRLHSFGPDFLEKAYPGLTSKPWDYRAATLSYWREIWRSLKESFEE